MDLLDGYKELKKDLTKHIDKLDNRVRNVEDKTIISEEERKAIRKEMGHIKDIADKIADQPSAPKTATEAVIRLINRENFFALIFVVLVSVLLFLYAEKQGSPAAKVVTERVINNIDNVELMKEIKEDRNASTEK